MVALPVFDDTDDIVNSWAKLHFKGKNLHSYNQGPIFVFIIPILSKQIQAKSLPIAS